MGDNLEQIDVNFDVFSDTPPGADPDKYSPTLKRYHQRLWSKPLPNGSKLSLSAEIRSGYLVHSSNDGELHLASDAISNTFMHVERMKPVVSEIPEGQINDFYRLGSTIGAYTLFPGKMIGGKQTINMARGCHPKIRDRFDLTLECIRRHYFQETSPLSQVLDRYKTFFNLFQTFEGYADFFLFNDLISNGEIKFYLPFGGFDRDAYPADPIEYVGCMNATMDFIRKRNQRISELSK